MSALRTKHLVWMGNVTSPGMLLTAVGKCIRLADCLAGTTTFLAFTCLPCLWKAIWLASRALLTDRQNCVNMWSNTREFLLLWLDSVLFHCLMTSSQQVDKWSATHRNVGRKMKDGAEDIHLIRGRFCESGPRALLVLRRTVFDAVWIRVVQVRLRHSCLLYTLSWVLYNMIWRPPLSFMYLFCTTVNEFSFCLALPVESRAAKRRRHLIMKQLSMARELPADRNRKPIDILKELSAKLAITLGVDLLERHPPPSPNLSPIGRDGSTELRCLDWNENEDCEQRYSDSLGPIFPLASFDPLKIDSQTAMPYYSRDQFSVERYFNEMLDDSFLKKI